VGRVVSPTLAMAVLREAEISAFQPETFYTVNLALPDGKATSGRMKEKADANALAQSCANGTAVVTKCEREEKSEKAPVLYDLTSLQRDANRLLGFTAQQTLDYLQSLYERKLTTYPRTDSRYLTDDMAEKVPALVSVAATLTGKATPAKLAVGTVINSKKVSDHHAIIPTMSAERADLSALPSGEREILRMIATRLLASVAPPYRYAETVAEFRCGEEIFAAKGKTVLDAGWKAIEKPGKADKADAPLPMMQVGDSFPVVSAEVKEGQTKPKAHYTEDTLLSAMERAGADEMPDEAERKGIGTPATRAGIIERLVTRGFLERKGDKKAKNLIPTEKGAALITVLPEQLQSASMTADWEEKLLKIERGEYSSAAFMSEIVEMVTSLVDDYQVVKDAAVIMPDARKSLGKCPVCGADVVERPKSYACSNRQCNFVLWKSNRYFEAIGKKMTESVAKRLLKTGCVRMKDCYSRRLDRYFDATIFLDFDETGKVQYRMEKGM
ncbi:MAG: DNA topoisomerase III, partial [Clostridiales bacterium]|nr:DNA topoisomerase III [Clostridiales bacterium]